MKSKWKIYNTQKTKLRLKQSQTYQIKLIKHSQRHQYFQHAAIISLPLPLLFRLHLAYLYFFLSPPPNSFTATALFFPAVNKIKKNIPQPRCESCKVMASMALTNVSNHGGTGSHCTSLFDAL